MDQNLVGWFEIPVADISRAKAFYDEVFNIEIQVQDFGGTLMGWFPFAEEPNAPNASGSLIYSPENYQPVSNGTLIYLASQSEDVNDELAGLSRQEVR